MSCQTSDAKTSRKAGKKAAVSCKVAMLQLWKEHGKVLGTHETKRLLPEYGSNTVSNNFKKAKLEYSAAGSSSHTAGSSDVAACNSSMPPWQRSRAFDLGDGFGTVVALCAPPPGVQQRVTPGAARGPALGDTVSLPNSLWAGYTKGRSVCVLDGYVDRLAWTDGPGPAYIVRTLEDGWHYPFPPDKLLEHARWQPEHSTRTPTSRPQPVEVEVEVEVDGLGEHEASAGHGSRADGAEVAAEVEVEVWPDDGADDAAAYCLIAAPVLEDLPPGGEQGAPQGHVPSSPNAVPVLAVSDDDAEEDHLQLEAFLSL